MESWINSVLESGQVGIVPLIAVFLLGIISVVTCVCNYSLFAVVAGYSGATGTGDKQANLLWSGITFLLGAVLSMAILGALFGYLGNMVTVSFGMYGKIFAGILCVLFGIYSMDLLPLRMPSLNPDSFKRKAGIFSAILFGLTIGILSTAFNSCCNPVFPVILAVSFVKGSILWGLSMLSLFALGYALPLALGFAGIRFGLGKVSRPVAQIIKYAGGILLVALGFYFLITL